MGWLDLLKALIFGLVEGISEWLPISSTGHLILLDLILPLDFPPSLRQLFLVIIQLAAIFAVVVLFFRKIWPFQKKTPHDPTIWNRPVLELWLKIIVASVPAGIVGIMLDDWIEATFYNAWTVAIMLIAVALALLLVERWREGKLPQIYEPKDLTYTGALIIGLFQVIAAMFPGTSRSGACIIGALLIGCYRPFAAEFTFLMAIPVMAGASLLKLVKLDYLPAWDEIVILLIACVTSFVVSMVVIDRLMAFVKRHKFTVFAYYRIVLGIILLVVFAIRQEPIRSF